MGNATLPDENDHIFCHNQLGGHEVGEGDPHPLQGHWAPPPKSQSWGRGWARLHKKEVQSDVSPSSLLNIFKFIIF